MSGDFATAGKGLKGLVKRHTKDVTNKIDEALEKKKQTIEYTNVIEEIEDDFKSGKIDDRKRAEEILAMQKAKNEGTPMRISHPIISGRIEVNNEEQSMEAMLIINDLTRELSTPEEAIQRLKEMGITYVPEKDSPSRKQPMKPVHTSEMIRLLEMRKECEDFLQGLISDDWLTPKGAATDMDEIWRRIIDEYLTIFASVSDLDTIEATGLDALRKANQTAQEKAADTTRPNVIGSGATISFVKGIQHNRITFS